MEKRKKFRKYPRFKCEEPVEILGSKQLRHLKGVMRNFSIGGLYVEISDPLQAGDFIVIKTADDAILDPVSFGSRKQRQAEVQWYLEIGEGSARRYGCGIAYVTEKHDEFIR